jgi:hypothetical protein
MPSKGPEIEYKRKATSQKNHGGNYFQQNHMVPRRIFKGKFRR